MGMGITTTHLSVKPSFLTFSKWEQASKESKTFIFRTTARQREAHKVFVRSKKSYSAKRKKHARPPLPATPPHLHDKLCYLRRGGRRQFFQFFPKKKIVFGHTRLDVVPPFPQPAVGEEGGGGPNGHPALF